MLNLLLSLLTKNIASLISRFEWVIHTSFISPAAQKFNNGTIWDFYVHHGQFQRTISTNWSRFSEKSKAIGMFSVRSQLSDHPGSNFLVNSKIAKSMPLVMDFRRNTSYNFTCGNIHHLSWYARRANALFSEHSVLTEDEIKFSNFLEKGIAREWKKT